MRLSEAITIYLAIGAPVGVNHFLRQQTERERLMAHSLLKAASAGLLWPFMAVASFLGRPSSSVQRSPTVGAGRAVDALVSEKIPAAQRRLFAALDGVRQLAHTATDAGEELEQTLRAVREAIEKYVGLTLALAETNPDAPPASQELELCRVAGRTGDDLLLAGRCLHRRNLARLVAHQARSRTELLHALATVRELREEASVRSAPEVARARRLSVAVLKFYGEAINLLSLLEDESAARSTARLLDAECARLRRLEALDSNFLEAAAADERHVRHNYTDWQALAEQ